MTPTQTKHAALAKALNGVLCPWCWPNTNILNCPHNPEKMNSTIANMDSQIADAREGATAAVNAIQALKYALQLASD